ncbi:MAG: hypothetical protein IPP86_00225 [Bacteroidetes bacterium]|nr:hypothetical protein [Bacteroidota bacterium]
MKSNEKNSGRISDTSAMRLKERIEKLSLDIARLEKADRKKQYRSTKSNSEASEVIGRNTTGRRYF